jgi:hypothetical protein
MSTSLREARGGALRVEEGERRTREDKRRLHLPINVRMFANAT